MSMLSVMNRVIRSLFALRLENCFSHTSLKRARALRLIASWFSKIASERNETPHLSNCKRVIVASRVLASFESA